MVADNGSRTDGISDVDCNENELHIHQHTVCRHAVFSDVFQELKVIDHADDGGGDIAHQFRGAVGAGAYHRSDFRFCHDEAQQACVRACKVDKGQYAAGTLADSGGEGSSGNTPPEYPNEERVKNHVDQSGSYRYRQPEFGAFGCDKETLEDALQHKRSREYDHCAAVEYAVRHHFGCCAEEGGDGAHENNAENRQDDSEKQCQEDHHGKIPVRFLTLSLSKSEGYKGSAACADHETHTPENHNERHHEIDCCEGGFSREIGHKKSVHHTVYGCEYHHNDGGKSKAQQFGIGKVIG